jgi:uncharacterized GH25 family protein/peroxiredoxin
VCMRKTAIISLVFLVCFLCQLAVGEVKEVNFKGRVVDADGRPIAGAKAKLYNEDYGQEIYLFSISDVIETTSNADGTFAFNKNTEGDDYLYGWIVVGKEGLALDCTAWDMSEDKEFEFKLEQPIELVGVVVDEKGEPVSEAQVSVLIVTVGDKRDSHGQYLHALSVNVAPEILSTSTDAAGKFIFMNLPAEATVEFLVQKTGKATVSTFRIDTYPREPLQYSPGQENIQITQPPESRIEGIVVDKDSGRPVAGVKLLIRQDRNRQVYGHDIITSGEDGKFSVSALAAGSYNLIFATPREELAEWVAEPVNVMLETGQTKENVKIELGKGGFLEVLVTDAVTKKLLEDAYIYLYSEHNSQSFNGRSDKEGIARVRVLPGVYRSVSSYLEGYSSFEYQNPVTIEEGTTKHIAMSLEKAPRISGVVRDAEGKPVQGAKLMVLPSSSEEVTSDTQGEFLIKWDRRGWSEQEDMVFCLLVRHEDRNLAAAKEISEDTEKLDIKLQPGVNLNGKVVNPNGKGIAGARIRPMLRLSYWGSSITGRQTEETDKNGNFEIKALPVGHNFNISANADGYGEQDVDVQTDNAVSNKMDIGAITLSPANLSITGHVVDTQGNPVANAGVESSGDNQPDRETRADNQGNFTINGVCTGQVYIRVKAEQNVKRLSARVHTDAGAKDIRIIVREGRPAHYYIHTKTYDQIIQASEKIIAGVAVDEDGSPVANVPVGVCCIKRKRDDGRFSWSYSNYSTLSSITDEKGRFAIELEEDAEYNLRFSPDNQSALIVYDIPAGKKDLKVILDEGGAITGRLVRMEKGEKVTIANVEVKLEQEDRASYTHLGFDRDRTAVTDSQGRFKFEHIQTKIRPSDSRYTKEWEYVPRVWQISYGDTSKSVAFYEDTTIDDFELVVGSAGQQISTGSALPEFDGIKINLSEDKTKGQRVIVCFFDYQQRPSRNCIIQLSKRSEQLKGKGVAVVAVQVSKIDENKLDEWIKEQNISFPVGMIQDNQEQISNIWGVKSLPWLILTDSEHVVGSQGFSIVELDEKLKNDTQ